MIDKEVPLGGVMAEIDAASLSIQWPPGDYVPLSFARGLGERIVALEARSTAAAHKPDADAAALPLLLQDVEEWLMNSYRKSSNDTELARQELLNRLDSALRAVSPADSYLVKQIAGMTCDDEGCPHYGTPHSHPDTTTPDPDAEFIGACICNPGRQCMHNDYGCLCQQLVDVSPAADSASLPLEPTPEILEAMIEASGLHETVYSVDGIQRSVRIYRAIRRTVSNQSVAAPHTDSVSVYATKAELEREGVEMSFDEQSDGDVHGECAEEIRTLATSLCEYKMAAPLCEAHKPTGGARSTCLICAAVKLSVALSRIDYACSAPNEMEISDYDLYCNEEAVLIKVRRMVAALAEARENYTRMHADKMRLLDEDISYRKQIVALTAELEFQRKNHLRAQERLSEQGADAARLDFLEASPIRTIALSSGKQTWRGIIDAAMSIRSKS